MGPEGHPLCDNLEEEGSMAGVGKLREAGLYHTGEEPGQGRVRLSSLLL